VRVRPWVKSQVDALVNAVGKPTDLVLGVEFRAGYRPPGQTQAVVTARLGVCCQPPRPLVLRRPRLAPSARSVRTCACWPSRPGSCPTASARTPPATALMYGITSLAISAPVPSSCDPLATPCHPGLPRPAERGASVGRSASVYVLSTVDGGALSLALNAWRPEARMAGMTGRMSDMPGQYGQARSGAPLVSEWSSVQVRQAAPPPTCTFDRSPPGVVDQCQ
jgi:hypothetical protein